MYSHTHQSILQSINFIHRICLDIQPAVSTVTVFILFFAIITDYDFLFLGVVGVGVEGIIHVVHF